MSDRHLAYPFHVGADGRSATPDTLEAHIRDEIIQLLLTNPGERPFLPAFGGGARRLVFEGNDDVIAGLAKANISHALNYWLGHRINVVNLDVVNADASLIIELRYRLVDSGEERRLRFEHGGGA
jgi:phage baseplate assembly protein W